MKISELLDELDGYGIIWTDSDLTGECLETMNLSHDTNIVPITYWERNTIKNCLLALQDMVREMKEGIMVDDVSYLTEWSDEALKIVDKWSVE